MADTESASKANGYNWRYSYTSVSQNESTDAFRGCEVSVQKSKHQHATIQFPPSQTTGHIEMEIGNSKSSIIQETVKYWPQYLSVISGSLVMFACGTHFGWVGPTLHQLKSSNSPIPITNSEGSWIAAMLPIGAIFGPFLGLFTVDYLGRRKSLLLSAIPFILAWILISLANTVYVLYIAQFFSGISTGVIYTIVPLYIGEISSPTIRGKLGNFMSLQFNFGILLEYIIVPYISITSNALISVTIPVIFLATFYWVPETPYYYIKTGQDNEARKSLKILRRVDNVNKEYDQIKQGVLTAESEKVRYLNIVKIPSNRKALVIMIIIMTSQECAGLCAVLSYAQIIFSQANSAISAEFSGVILGLASFFITILCLFLVDSWGRRPLLLLSCSTVSIPLAAIGIFFYLQSINYEYISQINLLPMIALIVYRLTFSLGLGPLPYICVGEMFPTNVKALASTLLSVYASLLCFIISKFYQVIADTFGTYTVFWLLSIMCLFNSIIMYYKVPETKGITLEKIQDNLKNNQT